MTLKLIIAQFLGKHKNSKGKKEYIEKHFEKFNENCPICNLKLPEKVTHRELSHINTIQGIFLRFSYHKKCYQDYLKSLWEDSE